MSVEIVELTDANRDQFGGDIAITSTIPAMHPKLHIPLPGTRASIKGASMYYRTLFKGDIIYKNDPSLEFNFTWWPDNGTEWARNYWMLLTTEKGFVEAEAKDWDIREGLKRIFQVVDGRVCIPIGRNAVGKDEYEVLMVRTQARWLQEQAALQQADSIQAEGEKRIAGSIDDKRVTVMPSRIEVSEHKYDVEQVSIKSKK